MRANRTHYGVDRANPTLYDIVLNGVTLAADAGAEAVTGAESFVVVVQKEVGAHPPFFVLNRMVEEQCLTLKP